MKPAEVELELEHLYGKNKKLEQERQAALEYEAKSEHSSQLLEQVPEAVGSADVDVEAFSNQEQCDYREGVLHHEHHQVENLLSGYPAAESDKRKYRKCQTYQRCPYRPQPGTANLRRRGAAAAVAKCHENELCTYERMRAVPDPLAALPLPPPYSPQKYGKKGQKCNEAFAEDKTMRQRNCVVQETKEEIRERRKQGLRDPDTVRYLATAQALDDWHAQALSMETKDYQKQKKLYEAQLRGKEPPAQQLEAMKTPAG